MHIKIVNIWASTLLPWDLNITKFAKACKEAEYEPEIHSAVIYRISEPKFVDLETFHLSLQYS